MPLGSGPVKKQKGKLAGVCRAIPAVIGIAGLALLLTACRGKQVLVDVMHPPKFRSP